MNVLRLKETMLINKVEFLEKNCVFLSYTGNLLRDVLRLSFFWILNNAQSNERCL